MVVGPARSSPALSGTAGTLGSVGSERLVIHGAREHNLKNVTLDLPRDKLDRVHGPVRLRQVLPRLRHDLRGGSAAVRRVAVLLRAAVPRPDGEAGRRLHRGALAGDLDRPEVHVAQPPVHGRDDHGGLRLPPGPVRADRAPALLQLRPADRPPDAGPDRRPGPPAPGGDPVPGPRARRPRTEGRVREAPRRSWRARGSRGPGSTARSASSPSRSGCPRTTSTRSRSSWTGSWPSRGSAAGWPTRIETALELAEGIASIAVTTHEGTRSSRRSPRSSRARTAGSRSTSWRRGTSRSTRRTAPARRATGSAAGSRSTPSSSCRMPRCRSTRARSRRGPATRSSTGTGCSRRSATSTGSRSTRRGRSSRSEARDVVLYGSDEEIYVRYKNRYGRQRSYYTTYEGVIPNLERRYQETDSGRRAGEDRAVHARDARAGRARAPPAAGDAGGDDRRPEHLAAHGPVDPHDPRRS